jgi:hypothetical protein
MGERMGVYESTPLELSLELSTLGIHNLHLASTPSLHTLPPVIPRMFLEFGLEAFKQR